MISLSVLGSLLVSAAQASERGKNSNGATPATRPSAATSATGILNTPTALGDAVKPRPDSTANNPERVQGKPQPPDRPGHEIAEEVKQARLDFLKQQQDLKKDLQRVIQAGRDQIRAQLKGNRADFSALQPSPAQDSKEKLRDHKEALESGQSEAKDRAKKRKDRD